MHVPQTEMQTYILGAWVSARDSRFIAECMAHILFLGSLSLFVLIPSGCAVCTVCKLHDTEQAGLDMDEVFCGGPCAPDDAKELAILVSVFYYLKTCVDFHRMIM
jgi:hypothetical protein